MASIVKQPNGRWRARYYDAAGKQHARHFVCNRDAENWIVEVNASVLTGTYVDPEMARIRVAEWCDLWLAGYTPRESTVRQARVHIKHIKAGLGEMPLSAVKPSTVRAWVASLQAAGYADSFVYVIYRRLSQVMADAVHDGVISRNPCSRRTSPRTGQQRPYVATTDQVWALYDAMSPNLRPAVLLGAFAGLRVAEAAGLRPEDVDFDTGLITPAQQYPGVPLKSATAHTPIPIPLRLADMLKQAAAVGSGRGFVANEIGQPVGPWMVEREVRQLRGRIDGLSPAFRYHDLRHYFASLLISSGLDVKVVQARLRHASAMTTLNTYGHLWPDSDQASRTVVEAVLRHHGTESRPSHH